MIFVFGRSFRAFPDLFVSLPTSVFTSQFGRLFASFPLFLNNKLKDIVLQFLLLTRFMMGVDRRGEKRKRCFQVACDCDEYEMPKEGNACDCGCQPTKHKLVQHREEAMLGQRKDPHNKRRKMAIDLQDDIFSNVAAVPCVIGIQEEEHESFVEMIEEIQPLSPCTPEEARCSASLQSTATYGALFFASFLQSIFLYVLVVFMAILYILYDVCPFYGQTN